MRIDEEFPEFFTMWRKMICFGAAVFIFSVLIIALIIKVLFFGN